jgi:glycosyltransferase involved in cell wall biosynthesis
MTEDNGKNKKLRICLVGPTYPYRGGISHYNTCLAGELETRHDIHAVNYSRLYPEFLFPGKTQLDESDTALTMESVRLIDSINPFTWIRAGIHIARTKPDAVIVQWWHPYFAPALFTICAILRLMGAGKIIFICHNVVPHERSPIDRILSKAAFSVAHGFIVQSKEDRANLSKIRPGARVEINPHPIYDFFARGGMSKQEARGAVGAAEGPLLLFFGYIRPYKGLKYLIEAMPAIIERFECSLLVVGEFYEDSEPYHDLVEKMGLAGKVTFVDRYVGNEEVESFFLASDLVVLPYISATQSGIVQISIAFDRPVVVTDVGGLPEVVSVGKTGFIVPSKDPGALAGAVIKFFEEGWSEKMAPHFEAERERFSWATMAEKIEKLYFDL